MAMNSTRCQLSLDSELRHLPASCRLQLSTLLDLNDNWKLLAASVPNPDRPNELLLKATNISLLDEQRKRPGGSPSNALLEYWGTYGRKRHTFSNVILFLEQCGLNRAADIIKNSVHLERETSRESAFCVPKSDLDGWSDSLPEYSSLAGNGSQIKPSAPNESLISFTTVHTEDHLLPLVAGQGKSEPVLLRLPYRDLQLATSNFAVKSILEGGSKLGEGSFGEVFLCTAGLLNSDKMAHLKYVAVKRFKQLPMSEDDEKSGQFIAELNTMYRFRHPNLVRLFGYSNDGPFLCIVTEYLENGSLQDFLSKHHRGECSETLSFAHRWQIAMDVAKALVYLHNYSSVDGSSSQQVRPYIHRDIKSANIFLDDKFGARLGDLGLVRQGSTVNTSTTVVTSTVIGTSVYMAPEAFRGDVSVKIDTFSYGVVLLELLTGMPAFDASREDSDIVSHIDEVLGDEFDKLTTLENTRKYLLDFVHQACSLVNQEEVTKILDTKCIDWHIGAALRLAILAKCCIEQRKKNRPTMNEVAFFHE